MDPYPGATALQSGADSQRDPGETVPKGDLFPIHPPAAFNPERAVACPILLETCRNSSPAQRTAIANGIPEALAAALLSPAPLSRPPDEMMPTSSIAASTDAASPRSIARREPTSKAVTSPSRVNPTAEALATSSRAGNMASIKAASSCTATLYAKAKCKATAALAAQPVPAPLVLPPTRRLTDSPGP